MSTATQLHLAGECPSCGTVLSLDDSAFGYCEPCDRFRCAKCLRWVASVNGHDSCAKCNECCAPLFCNGREVLRYSCTRRATGSDEGSETKW